MESGEKKAAEEMESMDNESDGGSGRIIRPPSEASLCPTEDEEDFTPMGPKCSIKEHLIKDKASTHTFLSFIYQIIGYDFTRSGDIDVRWRLLSSKITSCKTQPHSHES
nr:rho GDP-dissociation inhibitor 1-like [Ipomoea batatas]